MGLRKDSPLEIGEILAERYEVEALIGEGGMGFVYRARHIERGGHVAIKVMRSDAASSAEARVRFDREARAAFALRSEHVARILDVGHTGRDEPFMVMEHLVGRTLGSLIHERGSLGVADVVGYAREISDALLEAHGLGIIHRDLKPDNVFIVRRPDGGRTAKVLDFGIAKVENRELAGPSLTTTGSVIGTPWYMAPEQLDTRRGVTTKTDVWALGATIYHALTGKTPFDAESLYDLSVKVYAHEPTPITDHRPDLPRDLVTLVHGCLAKDAKKRLPLDEVALALGRIQVENEAAPPHRPRPELDRTAETETITTVRPEQQRPRTAILASDAFAAPQFPSSPALASGTVGPIVTPRPAQPPRSQSTGLVGLAALIVAAGLAIGITAVALRKPAPSSTAATPVPERSSEPAPIPPPRSSAEPRILGVSEPAAPGASSTASAVAHGTAPPKKRGSVAAPNATPTATPSTAKSAGALTHER